MARYIVERVFPGGLDLPTHETGNPLFQGIVRINAEEGVTWVHSYVSLDRTRTFCVYDAPSPEAIRAVAERNQLPVEAITEVSVLDPYFYHSHGHSRLRTPWLPFTYLAA